MEGSQLHFGKQCRLILDMKIAAICLLLIVLILGAIVLGIRQGFTFNPYLEIGFKNFSGREISEIVFKQSDKIFRIKGDKLSEKIRFSARNGGAEPMYISVTFEGGEELSENFSSAFANGEEIEVGIYQNRFSVIKKRAVSL